MCTGHEMPPCTPSLTSLAAGKEADAGAGFTLLELLIVLALVTLVVGISTVFLVNTLPASKLDATARDISSTIRYARTLAQTNNEQQVMTIDLDSNRYGIEGRGERNIPPGMHIKVMDPFSGEVRNGTYPPQSGTRGPSHRLTMNNRSSPLTSTQNATG